MTTGDDGRAPPRRWILVLGGIALFGAGLAVGRWSISATSAKTSLPGKNESAGPAPPKTVRATPGGERKSASSTVNDALGESNSLRRNGSLFDAGFAAAEKDPDGAIAKMQKLENQADRDALTRGIFAYLAGTRSLDDTLAIAKSLDRQDLSAALLATLESITSSDPNTMNRAEGYIRRFGIEAGVAMALAYDPSFEPSHADAWIAAFGDINGTGAMIGSFAAVQMGTDQERALALGASLTGWEREVFLRSVAGQWGQQNPAAAWDWVMNGVDPAESGRAESMRNILTNWVQVDFDAASKAFNQLTDPAERLAAVRALAEGKNFRGGTVDAVQWADGLPTEAEQDAAHAVIGRYSPQGIGAAIGMQDGYAVVGQLIPNGAARRGGQLQSGDRIVEVDSGSGEFQNVYGEDLHSTLNLIRGDAGSTVRLRVIRNDGRGNLAPRVIEITREQIVLDGHPDDVP